ncbi:imidazole glycerol phosphate synthase subunit HisH [candidate division KSB1 bacterium]|nr:imidazole glycerol phosphate synthase subunit HisH [bacterium]RKY78267.1 MAG: imidazole glycerol phosphate synthase subunit HisH [candidate division KSB1 bacterium]RKY78743.1 MAG: imidazole glycerol phosphate synthase subunit HisH [candidate division KSB1 bacterium]RKY81344.1 MAG: imidazole glycerol phosphate synthase subunit HisH [candidate division KSB1 bacterium]RKY89992.1 MAG: imidazole glycerol phosphate synthase subunit HisH [candidate division KSB1 bacterium]
MITIIDYGMGNLRSVEKALQRVSCTTQITNNPEEVIAAEKLVLPGVGAFGEAKHNLDRLGLTPAILQAVQKKVPLLGICLGFQLLFAHSEENGNHSGLGIFPGSVRLFPQGLKVPHMGWNQVQIVRNNRLLENIPDNSFFYFAHSYYVELEPNDFVIGTTEYGLNFVSVVGKDNIWGMQFHPEKSQKWGLEILKNFSQV